MTSRRLKAGENPVVNGHEKKRKRFHHTRWHSLLMDWGMRYTRFPLTPSLSLGRGRMVHRLSTTAVPELANDHRPKTNRPPAFPSPCRRRAGAALWRAAKAEGRGLG